LSNYIIYILAFGVFIAMLFRIETLAEDNAILSTSVSKLSTAIDTQNQYIEKLAELQLVQQESMRKLNEEFTTKERAKLGTKIAKIKSMDVSDDGISTLRDYALNIGNTSRHSNIDGKAINK